MTVALVTGANRGIGREVAKELARRGIRVAVAARSLSAAEELVAQLGSESIAVELDVTNPASVRAAAQRVQELTGGIDVLVNNAGILPEATVQTHEVVDVDLFQQTYATNVFGAVSVLQEFLPQLRRSPAGRIVNVTTTMASLTDQTDPQSPYYGMVVPAYQSSKAALNNVTIALAKALADTPIKVTSVCPGFVQTDLTPMNREQASETAANAARVIVSAATLDADAPSGTFVDRNGSVPW
ncbi:MULTISPECIES: SDR family NAD(P)-dependent oxidoreductase [Microbacterium]|uniref:SDR family NAD(P)-dependent oxidoreductase n=1 Tax=Microbacterium TaxID=33882 RepID=UPI000734F9F7|nr:MULTISPECIES: SDR family NAD(P)-dependent oxidoreductase [Microbacterium]KTR79224.1 short-chain dehydrogenase [Microbacterium oxydans]NIG65001.1 SDR family NAD(P)-dependent oxidoreductase [Microbacterium sp. Be9]